jgi:3-hydroxyisobutyrate dehydrogenase-like beta-hydroxyacid dehydrogenase
VHIGFIGLGQMGRGMATRLLEHGHTLIVWNRSTPAARAMAERGAAVATDPAQTLDSDIVISMLADDEAVRSVWRPGRGPRPYISIWPR